MKRGAIGVLAVVAVVATIFLMFGREPNPVTIDGAHADTAQQPGRPTDAELDTTRHNPVAPDLASPTRSTAQTYPPPVDLDAQDRDLDLFGVVVDEDGNAIAGANPHRSPRVRAGVKTAARGRNDARDTRSAAHGGAIGPAWCAQTQYASSVTPITPASAHRPLRRTGARCASGHDEQ